MTRSIDDLLDSFPEGWRPEPGDKLKGAVIGLESRTTEFGEYPIVNVRTHEGKDFAFHAYHTVAKLELEKLQPRVGDEIGIAYHGRHPTKAYERYRIVIARDSGGAAIDESVPERLAHHEPPDDDGIPF